MTDTGSLAGLTDLDIEVLKKKRVYREAWPMELLSGERVWVAVEERLVHVEAPRAEFARERWEDVF